MNGTYKELYGRLGDKLEPMVDEYMNMHFQLEGKDVPQKFWGIACYAVAGRSEGHYVHVDFIIESGVYQTFMLIKTFQGMDHALAIAAEATKFFYNPQDGWLYYA